MRTALPERLDPHLHPSAASLVQKGVRGMINDGQICLIIARVFDDEGEGANWSDILSAVKWAYQQVKCDK